MRKDDKRVDRLRRRRLRGLQPAAVGHGRPCCRERQDYNVELDRKINVLKAFGVDGRCRRAGRSPAADVEQLLRGAHLGSGDRRRDRRGDRGRGQRGPDPGGHAAEDQAAALPLGGGRRGHPLCLPDLRQGPVVDDLRLPCPRPRPGHHHRRHLLRARRDARAWAARCRPSWFQDSFTGKKVFADGELLPFEVVKGTVDGRYPEGNDHAVDGISGATMTGNGVSTFLNEDLARYEKYFATIRGGVGAMAKKQRTSFLIRCRTTTRSPSRSWASARPWR